MISCRAGIDVSISLKMSYIIHRSDLYDYCYIFYRHLIYMYISNIYQHTHQVPKLWAISQWVHFCPHLPKTVFHHSKSPTDLFYRAIEQPEHWQPDKQRLFAKSHVYLKLTTTIYIFRILYQRNHVISRTLLGNTQKVGLWLPGNWKILYLPCE